MNGSPRVFVHLLPTLIPPGTIDGRVAVAIDVLRATTVMVRALGAGVSAVYPCVEIDEARAVAAGFPAGGALLGGERQGLPIDGFDLGNSPDDYTPERCRGKALVMTTTNGTRAIAACLPANVVLVSSFENAGATVGAAWDAAAAGRDIHLVAAGTDGHISFEDTLLAGALLASLEKLGARAANDQALIASGFWSDAARSLADGATLESLIRLGRGGRRVAEIGLEPDLAAVSRRDVSTVTAVLRREPVRLEAVQNLG